MQCTGKFLENKPQKSADFNGLKKSSVSKYHRETQKTNVLDMSANSLDQG